MEISRSDWDFQKIGSDKEHYSIIDNEKSLLNLSRLFLMYARLESNQ